MAHPDLLQSLIVDVAWQSSLCLVLGLLASRLPLRPARTHGLLLVAIIAAMLTPILSLCVRAMGWGLLAAPNVAPVIGSTSPPASSAATALEALWLPNPFVLIAVVWAGVGSDRPTKRANARQRMGVSWLWTALACRQSVPASRERRLFLAAGARPRVRGGPLQSQDSEELDMPCHSQRALLLFAASVLTAAAAAAGGDGENAVLVVDPANPESLYVANRYRAARNVPSVNFVYIAPGASDYQEFVDVNLEGFFGTLANHRIFDHADYVLVPPGGSFFISAPNVISDSCFPVNRLGIASAYTLAWMPDKILGGLPSATTNHFAETSWDARYFDSSYPWLGGTPSASGQKYFIGSMLGYTGANGNTLQEVLDMIDRSAAVDGTHPAGTFYFVETPDAIRSNPRDHAYP